MNIIIKTKKEIELLREGGRRLAEVVQKLVEKAVPGMTGKELDTYAEKLIRDMGDEPAFLGYKPRGAKEGYPATLCVSVNNEVVHGLPREDQVFKEGDIVSIDCGVKHAGLFTDHAVTVAIGKIDEESQKLLNITKESLMVGIKAAQVGNTVGDIGHAIEKFVDGRYGLVRILSGHGVGRAIHEDPHIPNFGEPRKGAKLVAGMVIAIEPMLNIGGDDVIVAPDNHTFITKDGKRSAHFEHTIAITENGPEILTKL